MNLNNRNPLGYACCQDAGLACHNPSQDLDGLQHGFYPDRVGYHFGGTALRLRRREQPENQNRQPNQEGHA